MQSFVTFYENFYKQGDEYVYRAEGNPDNLELVAGEVNKFVPIAGSNSKDINKHMVSRAFVGYDVYSKKDDGGMKEKIYKIVKGTANHLGGEGYFRDGFTPMSKEHYDSLLDRSVNAFVENVEESYDFILYPQSSSRNVEDITERLEAKLREKFEDTETVISQIDKLKIDPQTIGGDHRHAKGDGVLNIEGLIERGHKAFMKAAESGYKDKGVPVPEGFDKELTKTLRWWVPRRLRRWAAYEEQNVVPRRYVRMGKPYSSARHLRPWNLQSFFAPLITRIKNKEAGDSFLPLQKQAEGKKNKKTGEMKSDISISGRMSNFSTSQLTLDGLRDSFREFAAGKDGIRFLIVDDNINTGDIFKQLTPIYELYPSLFGRRWGVSRGVMDFFFLMRDEKALKSKVASPMTEEEKAAKGERAKESAAKRKVAKEKAKVEKKAAVEAAHRKKLRDDPKYAALEALHKIVQTAHATNNKENSNSSAKDLKVKWTEWQRARDIYYGQKPLD